MPPNPQPDFRRLAKPIADHRQSLVAAWFRNQFNPQIFERFPNPFAQEALQADVERGHLGPLVDLLAEYAKTGDTQFRDIYRAERRRFAPHRQGAKVLSEYFRAVLPADEAAAVRVLGDGARPWLQDVHRPLVEPSKGKPIRILTLGDCLLDEIQMFLQARGLEADLEFDFRYYYFSAMMGVDLLDHGLTRTIREDKIDLIAVSYLSYEGIPLYRSMLETADRGDTAQVAELITGIATFIRTHLHQIRELTEAPVMLHNGCGLPLSRWRHRVPVLPPLSRGRQAALAKLNAAIATIATEIDNCFLIDETAVVERYGIRHCRDAILPKRITRDSDMHPAYLGRYLADSYFDVIRDWVRLRKVKLLLVDFDNTLWNGVMADGTVTHHLDRQKQLKRLAEQGVVLAAVSKNDPANIRWEEMALAEDDFAALKINWNLKVQSIQEIADELNLGLDSFVLLDDNPAECELVRQELPDVGVLDSTEAGTWAALERLFSMPNTRATEEAKRRTQMYREQRVRDEVLRTTSDYPALMAKLSLKAAVGRAKSGDLDRLVELVQRTNQFNTTTTRYSRGELTNMLSSKDHTVLVGELSDKFGDLGIVCVAVVRTDPDEEVIDNFVMSCRAMGFGLEQLMLHQVVTRDPKRPVLGKFIPSARNEPASTLYGAAGFSERAKGEWVLPAGTAVPLPTWIDVKHR